MRLGLKSRWVRALLRTLLRTLVGALVRALGFGGKAVNETANSMLPSHHTFFYCYFRQISYRCFISNFGGICISIFFSSAKQTVTIINYELHFCLSEVIGGDLTNRPDISHRHIWPSDLHPACGSEQVRRLSKPAEMIGCTILFLLCAAYFSGLELARRKFKGFKMPPLADVCPRSARPARKKSFRDRCNSCR